MDGLDGVGRVSGSWWMGSGLSQSNGRQRCDYVAGEAEFVKFGLGER